MPRFSTDPIATGRDDPDLLEVTTLQSMAATAEQTIDSSPTFAALRAHRLNWAENDPIGTIKGFAQRVFAGTPSQAIAAATKPSEKLSSESAQARIDARGLTGRLTVPSTGIRPEALDLLMDYKSSEISNAFAQDRYRGGIAGGAVNLATALAVSLADPINIASAFVPVVGEARYAQILGRAGTSLLARAGARAGLGAIEGAVGAALVEPLVYESMQRVQADYDSFDSLLNVGFGAVFGGALQAGAGSVADVLARRARIGAWAESITPSGERLTAPVEPGRLAGGGTQLIDGDDYVRAQWMISEADSLPRGSQPFESLEASQVGPSPWSDSGAPVMVGAEVKAGNKRLATILDAYGKGDVTYRNALIDQAESLGFNPDDVRGMSQPVLVRSEIERQPGSWGEFRDALQAREVDMSPQQREAALKAGIAQAVNGDQVSMRAAGHLDGTQEGVARFLEEKRIADAEAVSQRDRVVAENSKLYESFSKADEVDALEKEVTKLEQDIKRQAKDNGMEDFELTEVADLDESLRVEERALRGISMCMLRGA